MKPIIRLGQGDYVRDWPDQRDGVYPSWASFAVSFLCVGMMLAVIVGALWLVAKIF